MRARILALTALLWAPATLASALGIDHLSVLTYKGKIQVEVLASDEKPIKDIASFDATGKLLFRRDCPKTTICRALFVIDAAGSPQKTLTILARNTDGKSSSEVFTAQVEDNNARVYILDKLQDENTLLPLATFDFLNKDLVAGTLPADMMAPLTASTPVDNPSGETPKLKLGHYTDGDKLVLSAKATSKTGIDSIAILENGVFLDVELCSGEKSCTFTKIVSRQSGRSTYTFKVRTVSGAQRVEDLLVELP